MKLLPPVTMIASADSFDVQAGDAVTITDIWWSDLGYALVKVDRSTSPESPEGIHRADAFPIHPDFIEGARAEWYDALNPTNG